MPGGTIKSEGGDILLRTKGQAYTGSEFSQIVLRTFADGTRLTLGDVAHIEDGFVESESFSRFDGKTNSMLQVVAGSNQNEITTAQVVKDYIAVKREALPDGVYLDTWVDLQRSIDRSRDYLIRAVPDAQFNIDEAQKILGQRTYTLVFFGGTGVGKSTLINALLGRNWRQKQGHDEQRHNQQIEKPAGPFALQECVQPVKQRILFLTHGLSSVPFHSSYSLSVGKHPVARKHPETERVAERHSPGYTIKFCTLLWFPP